MTPEEQYAAHEQTTVEKGLARMDALGPFLALAMAREVSATLCRHGFPGDPRSCAHLVGRATDEEWTAMVSRQRDEQKKVN